jgi:dTDP-4-amino-4,6-dideoxygalactose transaminase
MLAPDLEVRSRLIAHMAAKRIKLVFHYVPLHNSPAGMRVSAGGHLPVTEDVSDRLVRLPLFAGMTLPERERIIEGVLEFR